MSNVPSLEDLGETFAAQGVSCPSQIGFVPGQIEGLDGRVK